MKKWLGLILSVTMVGVSLLVFAADTGEDWNFRGKVNYDQGAILQLKGVELTATASNLNAAAAGSAQTIAPTLVSNATLKVYGKTFQAVAGGGYIDASTSTNTISGLTSISKATNFVAYGTSTFTNNVNVNGTVSATTFSGGASGLTGNAPQSVYTNALFAQFRTGTCTNEQTISFSPALSATPFISAMYRGVVTTNSDGAFPTLTILEVGTTSFTIHSSVGQTNGIHWIAVNVL